MSALAVEGHAGAHRARKVPLRYRVPMTVSRLSWYALCSLLGITMLVPLLWMISIALKPSSDILQLPPQFLPSAFTWSNFVEGPQQIHFGRLLFNTVIVTVLYVFGSVTSSMLAGYAIARIDFRGRNFWFYLFTFSIFVPGIVTLVPIQRLFFSLNLIDTWWPLFLPAFFGNPVFIFLARQYFASVPRSIDDSAMIDGAGHWRIFTSLMIPLTKPLWITMIIMSFQAAWNDFLNPLVYLNSEEKYTLSIGMANFMGALNEANPQFNYYMASNLLYMLPPLLLFFLAQRYFMTGLGSLVMTGK
ncbi:MAG TPA: carbohydrate ABC transporter permease [Actinopolymorphaceae bacterium]